MHLFFSLSSLYFRITWKQRSGRPSAGARDSLNYLDVLSIVFEYLLSSKPLKTGRLHSRSALETLYLRVAVTKTR